MKRDILKEYTTLRNHLEQERAVLRARLVQLQGALDGGTPAPQHALEAPAPVRRKRGMSAAGRAAVAAAAKARWAAFRAGKAGKSAPRPAGKRQKHYSPAARARLAAAAKARWAKAKAMGKTRL
jgi:hypothetical protein